MKKMTTAVDQHIRETALDIERSFIVQAPAGSGKTELLIQRTLALLAHAVQKPEEILSITFTRKAAAEMRERVLLALQSAADNTPYLPHQEITRALALAALEKNKQFNWALIENPQRLHISTFDSFCARLCAQMPLLAKLGNQLNPSENADLLYREAIAQLFVKLEDPEWQPVLGDLLTHVGNRLDNLETLLLELLKKRDQWLPSLVAHHRDPQALKPILEAALARIVEDALSDVCAIFPSEYEAELMDLLAFSRNYLDHQVSVGFDSPSANLNPIYGLAMTKQLPGCTIDDAQAWKGIADFLLTLKGEFRKQVTKKNGFPTEFPEAGLDKKSCKAVKQRMELLLQVFTESEETAALQKALAEIQQLPPLHYTDAQWSVLAALIRLLPHLTAELQLVFQQHQTTDFTEITLQALQALGGLEDPSELALQLDYQINHILVDEFQDTSQVQFELLQKLIQSWDAEKNRTLFVVGDPMQSIYRFRNAEVGLFLRTQQHGLPPVDLESLQLQCNFRSSPALVEWFNQTFSRVFPAIGDVATGAIPYTASESNKPQNLAANITYHAATTENHLALQVVQTIQTLQVNHPDQSIAILIRTRTQLRALLPALQHANIEYKAVALDALDEQPEILDLLALTRALLHLNDRIAWLALLRSPMVGLTLDDLHALAQATPEDQPFLQNDCRIRDGLLHKPSLNPTYTTADDLPHLTPFGQQRLTHCFTILTQAFNQSGRTSFAAELRKTWITLGGPNTLQTEKALQNAESFLSLIRQLEAEPDGLTLANIDQRLHKLFATPDPNASDRLQIMTIHKAKGLEFDHVILPALDSTTRGDSTELFLGVERPRRDSGSDFILAPMRAHDEESDPIYRYLQRLEKEKQQYELARLLYVAATRAKQSLHLFAKLSISEEGETKNPSQNSFLGLLGTELFWEHLETGAENTVDETPQKTIFYRLKNLLSLPAIEPNSIAQPWVFSSNLLERTLGTVFHETLERFKPQDNYESFWKQRLAALGAPDADVPSLINQLHNGLTRLLADSRGQWILKTHPGAQNEFALTGVDAGKTISIVIDRTFVCDGVRWIIDYKTATPAEHQSVDEFLVAEKQLYERTMAVYARLMQQFDDGAYAVKCALYFPLVPAWVEW